MSLPALSRFAQQALSPFSILVYYRCPLSVAYAPVACNSTVCSWSLGAALWRQNLVYAMRTFGMTGLHDWKLDVDEKS